MATTPKFTKVQQAAIDAAVAEQTASRAASEQAAAERQAQIDAAIARENAKPVSEVTFRETINNMLGGLELPSGKRVIISLVAGVVLAGVAGFLGAQLVTMMVGYAATLTTSAFFLFMVQFIGYALTFIAAAMLGGKLQAVILDGGIDRGFAKAKGFVTGLFATKTVAS